MDNTHGYPTPCACPWCGRVNEAATGMASGRGPGEGDYSVCIACAGISRYNADLSQRRATQADLNQLPRGDFNKLMLAVRALKAVQRKDKTWPRPPSQQR